MGVRANGDVAWSFRVGRDVKVQRLVRSSALIEFTRFGGVRRAWLDDETGTFSAWSEPVLASSLGHEDWDVTPDSEGGFIIVGNDSWSLTTQAFDGEGRPRGPIRSISDNARYPNVTVDRARHFVTFHELLDRQVTGPLVVELDDDGVALGAPIHPAGPRSGGADMEIARAPEGLVAAWRESSTLMYAHLDESLAVIGTPSAIRTDPTSLLALHVAPDGLVRVSWQSLDASISGVTEPERGTTRLTPSPPYLADAGGVAFAMWNEGNRVFLEPLEP